MMTAPVPSAASASAAPSGRPAPPPAAPAPEPTTRLVRALRGLPVDATPIWLMRQAGRYLPEYLALRSAQTMIEAVRTPHIAAEITLQPLRRFNLDAAIIFSDLLPPLQAMGIDLTFEKGHGPRILNPIRTGYDVDILAAPPATASMPETLEAIRLVKQELGEGTPVIGFAGAPFTLAAYCIEGGGSKNYEATKRFMYTQPAAWKRLMNKLATVMADYLIAQAAAGADVLQVFDSWGGALSPYDYERYAKPYTARLIAAAARAGVPIINFSTGTGTYLETVADAGGDAVGVDWRTPLRPAFDRVGGRAIMGNLDPVALQAPWRELQARADVVLGEAADADGRPRAGYVFNLGHGILPDTPPDNVAALVDHVHARTAR